jgi:hypothetical protein
MNGNEWLEALPESPCAERDQMILNAINDGIAICEWSEIESTYKEHKAKFYVNTDAVYVNTDDGRFRFQVCAQLAQQCAELVGGMMPTIKIMDLRHLASNRLNATLLTAGPDMSSTTYSKNWNKKLEAKRAGFEGIVSDCGKPWINDNGLSASAGACLYGFFDVNAPFVNSIGLKLWQTLGSKHNNRHSDYSSTLLLMSIMCEVDGQSMSVADVAKDIELSHLLNYGGVLHFVKGK